MKKLIALLLTLTMLTGMTAALAEGGKPSFEMFGNGIWSYSMLGFEDHDFLFIHTATAGTNLAQRYVYCDDDTAVFVTHGGDAMIRFTYEERDHYLGGVIHWDLTEEYLDGLRTFYERAARTGLIEKAPELVFAGA